MVEIASTGRSEIFERGHPETDAIDPNRSFGRPSLDHLVGAYEHGDPTRALSRGFEIDGLDREQATPGPRV